MQFETLGKKNKKKILIGGMVALSFVSVISFVTTRAKYTSTQNLKLANGTVNFQSSDLDLVAVKISENGSDYTSTTTVPSSGYRMNAEKSKCRIPTETLKGENAPVDSNITIEYTGGKINILGMTTRNTKCYLYLDKIDVTKPTIGNVTSSVTQTTITVNVDASDNIGVTEYWYQIGTNTAVKGTGSSHTFTGLTGETPYTINVYVKDAEGNISDVTTETITTGAIPDTTKPTISSVTTTTITKTSITVSVSASDNKAVTEYWYSIDNGTFKKGTGSSYTFSGLTAGKSYIIKVYVKDAAGNQSTTTTKTFTTEANTQSVTTAFGTIVAKLDTPDFTEVATGTEAEENNGIFKTLDPMYGSGKYTYYWRGAATTNHVIFANLCWRIVRINGDGTIRLIYNGSVLSGNKCTGNGANAGSIATPTVLFNPGTDNSSYVGWTYTIGSQRPSTSVPQSSGTASIIKTKIEDWYKTNITDKGFDGKVASGKFCNDRSVTSGSWSATGSSFYYAARTRLSSGMKTPSLACENGDIYSLKIGVITADEVQFAGASGLTANTSYYLYNGKFYVTMSPYRWSGSIAYGYAVGSNGNISDFNVENGVSWRPVINLISSVTFNSGSNGTSDNPYVVK